MRTSALANDGGDRQVVRARWSAEAISSEHRRCKRSEKWPDRGRGRSPNATWSSGTSGKNGGVRSTGSVVPMMQAPDHGLGNDLAHCRRCDGSGIGGVAHQSLMAPRPMIITKKIGQKTHQVSFVQDDDMIQAVATNGPDQSLHERRLP